MIKKLELNKTLVYLGYGCIESFWQLVLFLSVCHCPPKPRLDLSSCMSQRCVKQNNKTASAASTYFVLLWKKEYILLFYQVLRPQYARNYACYMVLWLVSSMASQSRKLPDSHAVILATRYSKIMTWQPNIVILTSQSS